MKRIKEIAAFVGLMAAGFGFIGLLILIMCAAESAGVAL